MTDLIRGGLWLLSLGALVASSVLVVGAWRLGGAGSLLAVWIVGCGQIVLLAEGLSLLGALDWPGFLLGHLLLLGAVAAWAWRRPPPERWRAIREPRAGLARLWPVLVDRRAPTLPLLAAAVLLTGLIGLVVALWAPPNSVDSLTYHMTRVGFYLQFRSLEPYPTEDLRQVGFPANAELLILWTVAFLRADWLANLVQLLAWVVTTVAVYGLARQVGSGPRGALFAAGLFALLPQSVLQSTSTLNDLVVTSFVVVSLYFLFQGSRTWGRPRPLRGARGQGTGVHAYLLTPDPCLVLAGAAAGLAVGTKPTALLALPGLAVAFLVLFRQRLRGRVLDGLALGSLAAVLLGSYIYLQNWLFYGSPIAPVQETRAPAIPWIGFVANLARILFAFAFTDLSGPLADARAEALAAPLAQALGMIGERAFLILGIPSVVEGVDILRWGKFTFVRVPRVNEIHSGVGPIGGVMVALALAALVRPCRVWLRRRLLALAVLSYLVLQAMTIPFSMVAAGRFSLTGFALAAPLLAVLWNDGRPTKGTSGPVVRGPSTVVRRLAVLVLVLWSGVTGLYVTSFNQDKPLFSLVDQDRLGQMLFRYPAVLASFREVDQELGPTSTVGVYGDRPVVLAGAHWTYLSFGPRFGRTVLPLVADGYARHWGLRRPLARSNESLLATYHPAYVMVQRFNNPIVNELAEFIMSRCFELPLEHGPSFPLGRWELWRCRDDDPRSVLENGDFRAWPHTSAEPLGALREAPLAGPQPTALPIGWDVEVAGEGWLDVHRLEPEAGGEPFRLRLAYRAGGDPEGKGRIVQEAPPGELRGKVLVVDARVRADVEGAAVLWVDDGVAATETANVTTEAETLRVAHQVDPRASGLWIHLDASGAGRDATVQVRTLLAIPR